LDPSWATCKTGRKQSPINLPAPSTGTPEAGTPEEVAFHYQPTPLEVTNNGHTIMLSVTGESFMTVGQKRWPLLQIHFHAPSEHEMNGQRKMIEAHFVHVDAAKNYAVVGVLFDIGPEDTTLGRLFPHFPEQVGGVVKPQGVSFDPTQLLPEGGNMTMFRYNGSLTTPACSEGVLWHVLQKPRTLSQEQLDRFHTFYDGNRRPVQPLNGRVIQISHSSP